MKSLPYPQHIVENNDKDVSTHHTNALRRATPTDDTNSVHHSTICSKSQLLARWITLRTRKLGSTRITCTWYARGRAYRAWCKGGVVWRRVFPKRTIHKCATPWPRPKRTNHHKWTRKGGSMKEPRASLIQNGAMCAVTRQP